MTDPSAPGQRRRRSAGAPARDVALLRSPHLGRRVAFAVALLAAVLIAYAGYLAYHAARNYGAVPLGISRAEVRYLYGAPAMIDPADTMWRYASGGAVNSFRFGPDGALATVSCTVTDSRGACPDVLGVAIGTGEDDVWSTLGTPAEQTFPADAKLLDYPGLGVRVLLRRGVVVALEHRRHAGRLGFLPHAIQLLIP